MHVSVSRVFSLLQTDSPQQTASESESVARANIERICTEPI